MKSKDERQAVVIIHGMGEQEPMQTLRWLADGIVPEVKDNPMGFLQRYYVKPDELSELFDLRRITVAQDKEKTRIKTDLFEYYWAHQMRGTELSDVTSWGAQIFLRWKYMPQRLKWLHSVLVAFLVLALAAFVFLFFRYADLQNRWIALMAAGGGVVYFLIKGIGALAKGISINFIGDAARYLTPKPGNIINRQQIRKEGLELLRKLHGEMKPGAPKTPKYDRIVIVSHSLGSVIAYDLLTSLWASYHDEFSSLNEGHQNKLQEMQELVKQFDKKGPSEKLTEQELSTFQNLQSALLEASKAAGNPWRISDLITLGSPLSHAQLLLAKGKDGLQQFQKERMFPTCPPALEPQKTLSYNKDFDLGTGKMTQVKVPHHAALFGLTRWTNCWFKNDLVGGPMQDSFGIGIRDIELISKTHKRIPFLSHTHYLNRQETESIEIIRNIVFEPPALKTHTKQPS